MKKGIDKILGFTVIIAGLLGILMIYSSSSVWAEYKFNDPLKYVKHQFLFSWSGADAFFIEGGY